MAAAPYRQGVVYAPVERGSATTVPYHYVMCEPAGAQRDAPDAAIIWPVGFAEGIGSAAAAAEVLSAETGMAACGLVLPLADTVRYASNVKSGLDFLVTRGLHEVCNRMRTVRGRPVSFGGNSFGGGTATIASTTGKRSCDALVVVEPFGLTNGELGKVDAIRGLNLGSRLGIVTAIQNVVRQERGLPGLALRAVSDVAAMRERFPEALGYGVSDYVRDMTLGSLRQRRESGKPTKIVAGQHDACFRQEEYRKVLAGIGCADMLVLVDGQHASMESETGRRKLAVAARLFRAAYDRDVDGLADAA